MICPGILQNGAKIGMGKNIRFVDGRTESILRGPETGSAKVIRGGGWVNCLEWHHAWPETVDHLEVNSRCWWPVPDEGTSSEEGFRLVYMK